MSTIGKCRCETPGGCPWHQAVTSTETFDACRKGQAPTPTDPPPCIYLGERIRRQPRRLGQTAYNCRLYGDCTLEPNGKGLPNCADCKDRMLQNDPDIAKRFIDPLKVTDRSGRPTDTLRNMLNGGAAFLVCGGPSLKQSQYERLAERGIFSLGINNVCGFAPVSAFVCSDPPMKFHSGIFLDPKMFKFLPTPKIHEKRGRLRQKLPDGTFRELDIDTTQCPNVWGFQRRSWLVPDETWFTEPSAAWGNHNDGVRRTGQPKTVCTMLLGLRLLQYLGARRIFLLGCDFYMDPRAGTHGNYAFGEEKDDGAVQSNNAQLQITANWLARLRPTFERFGFYTYNCYRHSHLRAFDYVPFEKALQVCRGKVPPEPWDLSGWYRKK